MYAQSPWTAAAHLEVSHTLYARSAADLQVGHALAAPLSRGQLAPLELLGMNPAVAAAADAAPLEPLAALAAAPLPPLAAAAVPPQLSPLVPRAAYQSA